MKKLVTHNQGFHADDVFAYAILKEVLTRRGETWTIERTRDQETISNADIVFDVGEEYDPARNRFDHHQKNRAGMRENGVLYASAGLIWKHFGHELCSEAVWQKIDSEIVCSIDAPDNGQDFIKEYYFPNTKTSPLGNFAYHFNLTIFDDKTSEKILERFEDASNFFREIMARAITAMETQDRIFKEVSKIYESAPDKKVLVWQKDYGRPSIKQMAEFIDPIFIVYPNDNWQAVSWKIEAVPKTTQTSESRVPMPQSWHGLRDEELQKISGISDAIFCHPSGFLMAAKSFESAMKITQIALNS